MTAIIEELLGRYEKGQVSRRHIIASLAALFATSSTAEPQTQPAPIAVRTLNHVSISVSDVKRSVDFYQSLFGMTVKSQQGVAGNAVAGGGSDVVVNLAPGTGPVCGREPQAGLPRDARVRVRAPGRSPALSERRCRGRSPRGGAAHSPALRRGAQ